MNKSELLKKLMEWNKTEIKKKGDKEIVIFKSNEVFEIFKESNGGVLNPFNDYTYEWLSSFFSDLQYFLENTDDDDLEELLEEFRDDIHEYIDAQVSVYTSDLTEWLNDRPDNVYYITEVQEEFGKIDDGFKLLQMAQYKAIEEVYNNALEIIKEMV